MRSNKAKLVLVGVLCLLIFYFSQWQRQDKLKEVVERPHSWENSLPKSESNLEDSAAKVNETSADEMPHSSSEISEALIIKTHPKPENLNDEVGIDFERLETLYQKQANSDIKTKMNELKPFEGLLAGQEKYFYGAYQGLLPENKILRLNLEFNKSYDRIGRDTCLVLGEQTGAGSKILMRAERLRLYRSAEPGYLILVADGQAYLEIYLTQLSPRILKAYLKIPGSEGKVAFQLREKPEKYNGKRFSCEDFWSESK